MIFLKRFEARGFKSFADMTRLNFDVPMIGIVGPNGSGKSNVIDAIKWVLGEKSIKSLRGKKSDDIIFHGSNSKEKSEFAEVTLTFDNTSRILHIDLDEVAVTRRLYRGDGNNEYYINGEQVRLKDLMDIFVDTGLSKGSLGIISQGTITWFADSKPEDRRTIFEEAAGIGLYIRRKEESLRQLERTQTNLNRLSDITKELFRDIKKLEIQVSKVKEYKLKKDELTKLDISILVKDLSNAKKEIDEIKNALKETRASNIEYEIQLKKHNGELSVYKNKLEEADLTVSKLSIELSNINEKINKIEIQKSIIENQIKASLNDDNVDVKVSNLKSMIFNLENDKEAKIQNLVLNKEKLIEYENDLVKCELSRTTLNQDLYNITSTMIANKSKLSQLENILNSKPNHGAGSKAILENKSALTGVLGSVMDFINCDPIYSQAITIAIGKNVQNIIVNTQKDAKRCIDFLVKNKAGVTTFMPVYELKPKSIRQEHLDILEQIEGYIGVASNLILNVEQKIKPVIEMILGRVIIASDFDAAINISKYTNQIYKVITLDGQTINPHGTVTGGFSRHESNNFIGLEDRINDYRKEIEINQAQIEEINQKLKNDEVIGLELRNNISEIKLNIFKLDEQVKSIENNIVKFKHDLNQLKPEWFSENNDFDFESDIIVISNKLNSLFSIRDKIENDLNSGMNNKKIFKKLIFDCENIISNTRLTIEKNRCIIMDLEKKEIIYENVIINSKNKLNETYKMTIENAIAEFSEPLDISDDEARQKIERLSREIGYIGNINMDSIDELKEKSERYEKMKAEELEIAESKRDLLNAMLDLDNKAHEAFSDTINKINEELPKIFRYLFGGGTCSIEYTNPSNILNSGIEIKASPPGKHINSLFALSGGEKTLVALSVLFAILKISSFPLVILDEGESALDPSNVERFASIISAFSDDTQFLVITHRPLTMEKCNKLYGATMLTKGVTTMIHVTLKDAIDNYSFEEN